LDFQVLMFTLHEQPPRCPVCQATESRRSRNRGLDRLPALIGLQPWRCRTCTRRFWRMSVSAAVRLVVVSGMVALGGLWLRWMLNG
jgi:transposase-like protein